MKRYIWVLLPVVAVGVVVFFRNNSSSSNEDGDEFVYDPDIEAVDFVAEIDNPYFTLLQGASFVYEGDEERIEVEVLGEKKVVFGVEATVVRDRVYVGDELVEDTFDWFAQDVDGNVWYLGEESKDYEDGELAGTTGSWEAGVNGALPGVVMWANPEVGEEYYQEYYQGVAEDKAKVLEVDVEVVTSIETYGGCVKTLEWNPLEEGTREYKYYCEKVGNLVLEEVVGGDGRVELVEEGSGI